MSKLVYGVGRNDLGYPVKVYKELPRKGGKRVRETVFLCPYYAAWTGMLERCYSKKSLERNPSYIGTSVCDEWLSASAFKKWMEQQDWEGKSLDKDIIVTGNKVYSPETCAFVLQSTNKFVTASDAIRGEWPIGVSLCKQTDRYLARCNNPFTGKPENLRRFSTPGEAHEAWRKCKHDLAQLVADAEVDPRVIEALKKRYSFEEWYK